MVYDNWEDFTNNIDRIIGQVAIYSTSDDFAPSPYWGTIGFITNIKNLNNGYYRIYMSNSINSNNFNEDNYYNGNFIIGEYFFKNYKSKLITIYDYPEYINNSSSSYEIIDYSSILKEANQFHFFSIILLSIIIGTIFGNIVYKMIRGL